MKVPLKFQTLGFAILLVSFCAFPAFATEVSSFPKAGGQAEPAKVQTYSELVKAIRGARAESRVRVEKAVEQERVRQAWEIGKLIDEHVLQHKERADYGKQVLLKLSKDLGVSDTELGYMLRFARAYPTSQPAGKLSWSHYMELLSLDDETVRHEIADKAEKEKWTRDQIRAEVKRRKAAKNETLAPDEPKTLTPPEMGQPGTYKIILAKAGPYAGQLALDLGFSNYFKLSELLGEDLSAYKEGNMLVFYGKELQILGRDGKSNIEHLRYTYNAWVVRVLDGDTFEAVVDLGFGVTTTQTLRLRGIDAPELKTRDGQEAKAFVEKMLVPGASISIKTSRSDKYDRYLVDVFATDPESGEDKYLNSLLLEKGLAVKVSES